MDYEERLSSAFSETITKSNPRETKIRTILSLTREEILKLYFTFGGILKTFSGIALNFKALELKILTER